MHIIKLDATPSTNQFLKQMVLEREMEDYTMVITNNQTNGRGQMGAYWLTQEGKNLTFSILKKFEGLEASQQVYLNCAVSLALYDTLTMLSVPEIKVKWPNDIMSGNKKLCGILIENILQGNFIGKSVIGIGLNVNQLDFGDLKDATSIRLLLGKTLDLNALTNQIVICLKKRLNILETNGIKNIKSTYEQVLYRKDTLSTFQDKNAKVFMGLIKGVSDDGKLVIQKEDEKLFEFALKEIRLLN